MSWFSREWDGVHREGCPCYNESDVDEPLVDEINCRCYEIIADDRVDAADAHHDRMKEDGIYADSDS